MLQQNFISKIRVGILFFFIFPLRSFSQDISGVWVGYMFNDTTHETIHYELAINDLNGKTSGFSHTTFIISNVQNIGVKEVKVRQKKDHVYVEDEKFVYDNYEEPAAKGVKMFSFLTLSKNDSADILSGIWRTNATRKYNPLTGSIFLLKKKKVEPQQTIIVKKLIELGLANQLAFLPPSIASQNNVALNDKNQASPSSSQSNEFNPLKENSEVLNLKKTTGNEQGLAENEAHVASKTVASSGITTVPVQKKNDRASEGTVSEKGIAGKEQNDVMQQEHGATDVETRRKEPDEKAVAINQTVQTPQTKRISPSPFTSNPAGEERNGSIVTNVMPSGKPIDTKATNEKRIAINQSTQIFQNNKTSPASISSKTDSKEETKLITNGKAKTLSNLNDTKTDDNTISINQPTQTPQNNNISRAPSPTQTEGIIQKGQAKNSANLVNVEEEKNSTVAINEKKLPRQPVSIPGIPNSSSDSQPVQEKIERENKKANNIVTDNQATATNIKSSVENKNESAEKQLATDQNGNSTLNQQQVDNNKNTSNAVVASKINKENVPAIGSEKVNKTIAQSNEARSLEGKQEIGVNEIKTQNSKQTETVEQQKKVKINPLSNQQKPNTLEPTVVTKPKLITPPAAADLASRRLETIRTVEIAQDSLVLSLYDNGSIDGDTVSVLMNGKVIMPRVGLLASAISKTVYLTPEMGDSVSVVMYAENLGSIPPNTGLLVIHDGPKIYEIRFSGDLNKNSKIILVRKKKT